MNDIIDRMRQRDTSANIQKIRHDLQSLSGAKASNATKKTSHFYLGKTRSQIPRTYLDKTNNLDRINLNMLNDYLNLYNKRLARAVDSKPNEIQIDFSDYYHLVSKV